MFPRHHRARRATFPTPRTAGKRVSTAHFLALIPTEGSGYAVVVSKKVARLSVTRHRLKRRVIAALRALNLPPGLIVYPRATAGQLDSATMQGELEELLSKLS